MDYLKVYVKLMRKAKTRGWSKNLAPTYVETHHIFPVSIFGLNKKTVCLTAREHYMAHALLYIGFKKRYGSKDSRTQKMRYAWWQMSNTRKYCNSGLYEALRIEFAEMQKSRVHSEESKRKRSEAYKGKNNPMFGKPRSEETKRKISNTLRNRRPWETGSGKTNIEVWKEAEKLYNLWIKNNKPGSWRLAKLTKFSFSNVNYIHRQFKTGWVPSFDSDYQLWLTTFAPAGFFLL